MTSEFESDVFTRLAYDGPALKDGSMDVFDLAPALLSLGELLQDANAVLNGRHALLDVRLQADFREGSFDYGVAVYVAWVGGLNSILGHEGLRTAKEIAEYVGLVTGVQVSLFGFIRWLNGRKPVTATTLKSGAIQVTVTGDNNNVIIVPAEVYRLAESPKVRNDVAGVVRPLEKSGITSLEVRGANAREPLATHDDLAAFDPIVPSETDPVVAPREALLEVIKPSFEKSLKWMFSDGSQRFSAEMKDERYVEAVSAKQRAFAKGTFMRVRMRSVPKIVDGKLKTFHEILEVLDDQPQQPRLLPEPT